MLLSPRKIPVLEDSRAPFYKSSYFLQHDDAMRKRGLCCGPVSVCPSVRLSVTFVHSIEMAKDIVKLLCRLDSPIILVF